MKLDEALNVLISGGRIKRATWEENEYLESSTEVKSIGGSKGLIIMHVKPTSYGESKTQWQPLVEEISEDDWVILEEEK